MIKQDEIKQIYEQNLSLTNAPVDKNDDQLMVIMGYITKDVNARILDAGCGIGKYASKLYEIGYNNVYAVDLFDHIHTDAFEYQKASIDNLFFDNNFFDFIFSNSVIYYLNEPQKAIKEFSRVLKPKKYLVFSAHTRYSLFTLLRVVKRFFGMKSVQHLKGVRFYSTNTYLELLKQNQFDIIWVDGFKLSFCIYPLYYSIAKIFRKHLSINLPLIPSIIYSNKLLARLKSIFAYHFIIVAQKK